MTGTEYTRLAQLVKDSEDRIMKRLDDQDTKIDKASEFSTVFMGATRILMWLVIFFGGVAAIYAAAHGVFSGSAK